MRRQRRQNHKKNKKSPGQRGEELHVSTSLSLVVRGLSPGVFSGVNWIGLRGEQGDNVLIYSWLTELEANEFCATVRGETRLPKLFEYELVAQRKLQQQLAGYDENNSSTLQSDTNPWPLNK